MDDKFLGTGMKFPPEIDMATGRFKTVSGNQSVKESIYLILMTRRTERFVRPSFGSDIMNYTFMDTGTTMLSIFRRNITQTLLDEEPRIGDIEVNTEYKEGDGVIMVYIDYTVSATNTRENMVFPFYLNSGEEEETESAEDGSIIPASFYDEDGNLIEEY